MGENKITKYGFYVSILGLVITSLALVRDYFDFKQNPKELESYLDKGSPILYAVIGFTFFIIGYLAHRFGILTLGKNEAKTIEKPKILIAYTDEKLFGKDELIISNSKLSKSVTSIKDVTVDILRTQLSNNEYDVVHLGIPIGNGGEIKIGNEELTSSGLMSLLEISNTQLLILGSCSSVNLAADSVNAVNMIAATENLNSNQFERWEEMFYSLLADEYSLTRAFNISKSAFGKLPIVMILKQDIIFKRK